MVSPLPAADVNAKDRAAATGKILGRLASTSGHVIWEKVRPPRAHVAGDVPATAADITNEWLTAVLCGGVPGAAVTRCDMPGGSSGTSTRHALRIAYNEAGAAAGLPTQLYAKMTSELRQRLVLGLAGVIAGEIDFFNRVRPHIDIETPRGYHSAVDLRSWRSISVIEDIDATKGARFLHSDHRYDRKGIEDLLADLATMHGTMWRNPELESPNSWARTPFDLLMSIKSSIDMRKRSAVGADRAKDVMPPALMSRLDDLWFAFEHSMQQATDGPKTFLHGDAHVGNTYVTGEGRHGYTDWQMVMRGSWAFDFALSVSSVLEVDDRRAWERDLLTFYLERLAQAGGEPPEFDVAWDAYRVQVLYPYHSWTYTIGRGALQPEMQPPELCRPIIERSAAAIEDLGSIEAAAGR